jgi:nicotinamide-nucleotide amidase
MDNNKLLDQLSAKLIKQHHKLATAESCTGGKIAATITDCSGSSSWFDRGFVTYSNQSKIDLLSVKLETLEKNGAVSEEVAREMAIGCLNQSKCDYALSITGIAGPGGGSIEKPVGTVWFAWATNTSTNDTVKLKSIMHCFDGDRNKVREQSVTFALNELLEFISI